MPGNGNAFGREYMHLEDARVGHGTYPLLAYDRVGNLNATKTFAVYQELGLSTSKPSPPRK